MSAETETEVDMALQLRERLATARVALAKEREDLVRLESEYVDAMLKGPGATARMDQAIASKQARIANLKALIDGMGPRVSEYTQAQERLKDAEDAVAVCRVEIAAWEAVEQLFEPLQALVTELARIRGLFRGARQRLPEHVDRLRRHIEQRWGLSGDGDPKRDDFHRRKYVASLAGGFRDHLPTLERELEEARKSLAQMMNGSEGGNGAKPPEPEPVPEQPPPRRPLSRVRGRRKGEA